MTEETALLYCTNKGVVSRGIDKIKKIKGQTTTNLAGSHSRSALREEKMSSSELSRMDFFELGDKTSLVCADPLLRQIRASHAEEHGLQIACAGNAGNGHRTHAVHALRHHYVQENFAGSSLRSNSLLSYLATCPWRNGDTLSFA